MNTNNRKKIKNESIKTRVCVSKINVLKVPFNVNKTFINYNVKKYDREIKEEIASRVSDERALIVSLFQKTLF